MGCLGPILHNPDRNSCTPELISKAMPHFRDQNLSRHLPVFIHLQIELGFEADIATASGRFDAVETFRVLALVDFEMVEKFGVGEEVAAADAADAGFRGGRGCAGFLEERGTGAGVA